LYRARNLRYFGARGRAHAIYNFPAAADFARDDVGKTGRICGAGSVTHARPRADGPARIMNFTAQHRRIGDAAKGLLPEDEISKCSLIRLLQRRRVVVECAA